MVALLELTLDPEPPSAGAARRAVQDALLAEGADDELIETTTLLVSEVVTNAVLHAGTVVRLRCEVARGGARVEVADESPVTPKARGPVDHDSTGRGLFLMEALAAESGVRTLAGGKVVWFVVGHLVGQSPRDLGGASATYTVRFVDIHVPMARAVLAYGEAVLRELALLSLNGGPDGGDCWHPPAFSLGPLLEALDRAALAGETVAVLDVEFPLNAKDLSLERLALVEEGHQLAREGKLLTVPAIPEVMQCRRWIYRQIHQQADGAEPEPWELPDDHSEADVVLDSNDRLKLDGPGAIVAADQSNRILYVNDAAERLLGTKAGELVGRRLTTIIPTDFRLAHLAGFARFQMTGESRIIGSEVTVPALRADGTTVTVVLLIEPVAVNGGHVFRANLQPDAPEGGA